MNFYRLFLFAYSRLQAAKLARARVTVLRTLPYAGFEQVAAAAPLIGRIR